MPAEVRAYRARCAHLSAWVMADRVAAGAPSITVVCPLCGPLEATSIEPAPEA